MVSSGMVALTPARVSCTDTLVTGWVTPPTLARASRRRSPLGVRGMLALLATSPMMATCEVGLPETRTITCGLLALPWSRAVISFSTVRTERPATFIRPAKGIFTVPSSMTIWEGRASALVLRVPTLESRATPPKRILGGVSHTLMTMVSPGPMRYSRGLALPKTSEKALEFFSALSLRTSVSSTCFIWTPSRLLEDAACCTCIRLAPELGMTAQPLNIMASRQKISPKKRGLVLVIRDILSVNQTHQRTADPFNVVFAMHGRNKKT